MTIRYNQAVATVRCGGFLKLLLKWEGSVYKLLWFELSVFLSIYAILSVSYHFLMNDWSKRTFEAIAQYCSQYSNQIPISFVLGFYVQRVISRFWDQFNTIPWPNRLAIYVSTYIQSNDERARLMRRTIMRYICLGFVMAMSSISPPIKRRFPTLTHMTDAGFLMPSEQQNLEGVKTNNNKYFVPFIWATSIVGKARKEGMIKSDLAVQKLTAEINDFRGGCANLFMFDWVSIPLGYTQVVSLAVYIFTLCCLLGRYQLDVGPPSEKHFPFFTILQVVFYMGWLKVAECGLSPFGDDDDDFEINLLVDRYLHESYIVVDEMFMKSPDMLKDQHWDLVDFDIPYTAAAARYKKSSFNGSTIDMEVPADKQTFLPLNSSYASLKNASSSRTTITSSHLMKKRKSRMPKRRPTLAEASESKESVVAIHVVPSSVKGLEAAISPKGQVKQPDNAAGQQPVELKPSTSAGQQPSTSAEQQPSTPDGQQPSTSAEQQPSTSAEQQPKTSGEQQPSTSAQQQPSTSAEQQPKTSGEQQPSTSAEQQPSTSAGPQRSTLAEPDQDTSDTVLTQQESALMSKIQDELRELRK